MQLEDITDAFCLSCVLFVLSVDSHTTCESGWFGSKCNYKCRCTNQACKADGKCTVSSKCQGGWFGPECQFADLAFSTINDQEIIDGDDTTCLNRSGVKQTKVVLREAFFFTWLRVTVAAMGSADLRDLHVSFAKDTVTVTCAFLEKHLVDSSTMDMHCAFTADVDRIFLDGVSAAFICSVYISGGRNVALKEMTDQDSTFSQLVNGSNLLFVSDKAVDGNTDQNMLSLSCSRTTNKRTPPFLTPTWLVKLSREYSVNRYVIYNRVDAEADRLFGFSVCSADSENIGGHYSQPEVTQQIYQLYHEPQNIRVVTVTIPEPDGILALCEVEVYGESICESQHYGLECERVCQCASSDSCFAATGGCHLGCNPGFEGPKCLRKCRPGTFGDLCNSTCSINCESTGLAPIPPCDHVTGACSIGCKTGFVGRTCDSECAAGTYGNNCTMMCNLMCAESSQADTSRCNPVTGACMYGCRSGFFGATCENKCDVGKFGLNCQQSCSEGCVAPSNATISPCDHATGVCAKGCQQGFIEASCQKSRVRLGICFTLLSYLL